MPTDDLLDHRVSLRTYDFVKLIRGFGPALVVGIAAALASACSAAPGGSSAASVNSGRLPTQTSAVEITASPDAATNEIEEAGNTFIAILGAKYAAWQKYSAIQSSGSYTRDQVIGAFQEFVASISVENAALEDAVWPPIASADVTRLIAANNVLAADYYEYPKDAALGVSTLGEQRAGLDEAQVQAWEKAVADDLSVPAQ